jgi:hypothetical protein
MVGEEAATPTSTAAAPGCCALARKTIRKFWCFVLVWVLDNVFSMVCSHGDVAKRRPSPFRRPGFLPLRYMRLLEGFFFSRNNSRGIRIFMWFSCVIFRVVTIFGSAYGLGWMR